MNIGPSIRRYRTARGLSQKQVADTIGVHSTVISQWENGHREPSWDRLRQLDEAVGANGAFAAVADREEQKAADFLDRLGRLYRQTQEQAAELHRITFGR